MSKSSPNTTAMSPELLSGFEVYEQMQPYRYIIIATAGAFGWELLSTLKPHYRLLFRERIRFTTVAYFVSLAATALFMTGCITFHTGVITNCQLYATVLGIGYCVAVPASAFLFLIRAQAVYKNERIVRYIFGVCWLGVVSGAALLPFSFRGTVADIPGGHFCLDEGVRPFGTAGLIASTVFDTMVFIAVSWKLTCDEVREGRTWREKMGVFFGGKALPGALHRAMLQSGQIYFLISVCGNLVTTTTMFAPAALPLYHAILTTPNTVLMNIMACKLFRDLRLRHEGSESRVKGHMLTLPAMECGITVPTLPMVGPERTIEGGSARSLYSISSH